MLVGLFTFSAGSMGTRYALDGNYRPTSEEATKDVAVGFFFGAVTSLLKSANMTGEAKARMSETVEQMKRDYGTILADSGGSVTFDALDDLAAKSAEVRNTLRTTQFAGQQDTVNGVMEFLDTLDDAVARARAGMGTGMTGWSGGMRGLQPGGAQGLLGLPGATLAPGGRMGGMPMLPGPVAVKDDWETALEEAVAEWKGSGAGSGEDIDVFGKSDIIFGKGTENPGKLPEKPFATSRPKYGPTQVDDVWNAHVNPETGTVTDPSGATIVWDRTKSRNGQWDMGHIPGQKYSDIHTRYMDGALSLDEFLKWYRNPLNYRPELPRTNRGHLYENN